ncbi:hypothetical protein BBO99_00004225 [Phytophthora kernoviae]|uniref:Uncharacterized protein n=3 Tax=Phytophthora kernoviae TaxID=325452 RepID=A0A3R7NHE7_9STRA|nr:hypothetical protein BBO99_00004225 [Phytophthora kernoviae]
MTPMAPRWLLSTATGRPLRRWTALPLRVHLSNDYRVFSVLAAPLTRSGAHLTTGTSLRTFVLRRAIATGPPGDGETEQKQQEREAKKVARILKQKLKVDMETARSLDRQQVVNVPNVITAARILATPYLSYLIIQGDHVSAIGLLAVAGISDWLDGYIARTFHQESVVGSFLDPFADKLLIGTLSLSMMWTGLLPLPLAALILGRDGMLIGGTLYHRLKTKDESSGFFDTKDSGAFQVKPSLLSKVNTALQLSAFGLTLTNAAWQLPPDPALHVLFGVVGTTTFLSGSEYLWGYIYKTGAFKPLRKVVEKPLRKVVEKTEAVKRPIKEVVERTKERLKK